MCTVGKEDTASGQGLWEAGCVGRKGWPWFLQEDVTGLFGGLGGA